MEETQALDLPFEVLPGSSEEPEDREVSRIAAGTPQPALQAPGPFANVRLCCACELECELMIIIPSRHIVRPLHEYARPQPPQTA